MRGVEAVLRRFPELAHLRVRRRAAVITIESGALDHPISHARLRRQTAKIWQLEMANHDTHTNVAIYRSTDHGILLGWTANGGP